jgi:hypothetical protein
MAPPKGGQPNRTNSNRPSSSFSTTPRKYPKVFITAANREIIQPLINSEEGEQRNNLEAEEVIPALLLVCYLDLSVSMHQQRSRIQVKTSLLMETVMDHQGSAIKSKYSYLQTEIRVCNKISRMEPRRVAFFCQTK